MKSIKNASFIKRLVAALMDGAVLIFTFLAISLFVFSPIANKAFGYQKLYEEGTQMRLDSNLYDYIKEGNDKNIPIVDFNDKDVEYYKERLHHYYCVYKTQEAPDHNDYITLEGGEKVLPKDYYTDTWFEEKFGAIDSVNKAKDASYDALVDFVKYIRPISQKIKRIEIFMFFPPFFISTGVFLVLIPMLFKNGETLGKKTMALGLVTLDGYQVKKKQVLFRQLFLLVLTTFSSFILGIGLTSFATFGVGVAIYFVTAFIPKSKRSMADWIAYVQLIDVKNSVFFRDAIEEEIKEKEVEENLAKYNKNKDVDKNVLQVGSVVVNEEAKEELSKAKQARFNKKSS